MATLQDTIGFIATEASESDIERIFDAARQRSRALRQIAAAAVSVGSTVKVTDISPKYLGGLTGTVTSIRGAHCDVTLDDASTQALRFNRRNTRFEVGDTQNYVLRGCPLSSCQIWAYATVAA